MSKSILIHAQKRNYEEKTVAYDILNTFEPI